VAHRRVRTALRTFREKSKSRGPQSGTRTKLSQVGAKVDAKSRANADVPQLPACAEPVDGLPVHAEACRGLARREKHGRGGAFWTVQHQCSKPIVIGRARRDVRGSG